MIKAYLHFQGLHGHGQSSLVGLVSANEASHMDKDAAGDTAALTQLLISKASPLLGHCLAALKALGCGGDTLDTPVVVVIGVENIDCLLLNAELLLKIKEMLLPGARLVKDQDLARGVSVHTLVQCLDHQITSGQPRETEVTNRVSEILSGHRNGLHELTIDIDILLVPPRVQSSDTLGQGSADTVLGLNLRRVLRNSVIATIECLNKALIHLGIQ